MADFCQQCSLKLFHQDSRDLAGHSTPAQTADELFSPGICEGCGGNLFDHDGICSDIWCDTHGDAVRQRLGYQLTPDGNSVTRIAPDTPGAQA